MKQTILSIVACLVAAVAARAVPAWPGAHVMTQPDGSRVTLRLCGDEFLNRWSTDDGYTVVRDNAGRWVYAAARDGSLAASDVAAHDAAARTAAERAFLASTPHGLADSAAAGRARQARQQAREPRRMQLFDYDKFRGLIVLVQPSDVAFQQGSPEATRAFYDTLVNSDSFTGFADSPDDPWTGSVRDYYRDNSSGRFVPHFDIAGPATVPYQAEEFYPHASGNGGYIGGKYLEAFWSALAQLDDEVDYAQYDTYGYGSVDMVFFIVAGYGSHYGNNAGLLWPHMSYNLTGTSRLDGVRFGMYACTTEMGGQVGSGFIDGIGTICHEFSHVLGLQDLYDADYDNSGGTSHHPGNWDLMAVGSYLNNGRTPAGYSLYERYSLGFAAPEVIDAAGERRIEPLDESNRGYLLRTPTEREYFLLENRQPGKWDSYLPGHGMLVTRVDSTSTRPWNANTVNTDPTHNYLELLRAGNTRSGDLPSDTYPGSNGVSRLASFTMPSLRSWQGAACALSLQDIAEHDGEVTFTAFVEPEERTAVETFDRLERSEASPSEGEGDLGRWRLAKCRAQASGEGMAVAMTSPSAATLLTAVSYNCARVSLEAHNTAGTAARLRLYSSTDGGETWTTLNNTLGESATELAAGQQMTIQFEAGFSSDTPVLYRIGMVYGSAKPEAPCLVDNFTIYYTPDTTPALPGDVNGDGTVDVADVSMVINHLLGVTDNPACDVNGDGRVDIGDINAVINAMLGK